MEGALHKAARGVEGRVLIGGGGGRSEDADTEVGGDEVVRIVVKLKGKASGDDGVPNEVWKFGGERVEEWIWSFCCKVWKGEGWPEQWKNGIIVPLVKKGVGDKVEDYRGVMTSRGG